MKRIVKAPEWLAKDNCRVCMYFCNVVFLCISKANAKPCFCVGLDPLEEVQTTNLVLAICMFGVAKGDNNS